MGREQLLGKLENVIATHGWAVQAASHERDGYEYSYTVGMERFEHPEIMILGFPHAQGHLLLNDIGSLIAKGATFDDWTFTRDIVEHYPVWFREIASEQVAGFATMATMRANSKAVRLLQVILPDAYGHYPWEQACDASYRKQLVDAEVYRPRTVQ